MSARERGKIPSLTSNNVDLGPWLPPTPILLACKSPVQPPVTFKVTPPLLVKRTSAVEGKQSRSPCPAEKKRQSDQLG